MARVRASSSSTTATLAIVLLCMTLFGQSYGQLMKGFYNGKCGRNNVESVIFGVVNAAFQKDRTIVAALLRMQFHDCFVRGCDASLLLDNGSSTEKYAESNGSVRGYELIDACKASLEQKCPGVVSCSDIIIIATRVAVALAKGGWYEVETGRRDGFVSRADEAQATLPGATIPVPVAIDMFKRRGITAEEFVLLLGGGHTVGTIHCNFFIERLYNYQGTNAADPSMNKETLSYFKATCPRNGPNNKVFADQTVGSEFTVDNGYYNAIRQGKGVLQIDQQIAYHQMTWQTVKTLASNTGNFTSKFGAAMVKLGRVQVLTGTNGQVRRNCRRIN